MTKINYIMDLISFHDKRKGVYILSFKTAINDPSYTSMLIIMF